MKNITTRFSWNYTSILNIIFLGILAVLYVLYRNRHRLGGGQGYSIDPVCGMQVETSNAPASTIQNGHAVYFCSDRCAAKFTANPAKSTGPGAAPEPMGGAQPVTFGPTAAPAFHADVDPVCGMTVDPNVAADHRIYAGRTASFCSPGCATTFDADPSHYAGSASVTDPVCGMTIQTGQTAAHRTYEATEIYFCGTGCAERFDADPAGFVAPTART